MEILTHPINDAGLNSLTVWSWPTRRPSLSLHCCSSAAGMAGVTWVGAEGAQIRPGKKLALCSLHPGFTHSSPFCKHVLALCFIFSSPEKPPLLPLGNFLAVFLSLEADTVVSFCTVLILMSRILILSPLGLAAEGWPHSLPTWPWIPLDGIKFQTPSLLSGTTFLGSWEGRVQGSPMWATSTSQGGI